MSTLPDNEFDLEKLFLPAWAQEEPSSAKYAKYEGREERPEGRSDRRGNRPPRREGPPPFGGRDANRPRRDDRTQGRDGGPRQRGGGRDFKGQDRGPRQGPLRERRETPAPLPELNVAFIPEERGVESLGRQIKMTGRAYPLFDIAQMILQKPERHTVTFTVRKNPEGKPIQPLFVCALDDSLWLSENEAIAHVLKKHFGTFYQAERTATEPPKGKYTFVAQCGMSGVILGPPNYHDYQNQLRKLHADRFSRLPFDVYKSRVKIVRDEEVVKKWVEDQSWKTEYLCLNMPEPLRLGTMEAVEQHFRENHNANIIKTVESHTLSGVAARSLRSPELVRLVRSAWEDQRRFPLQIATVLSQQFAGHGLQFFKVNKTITHVSVARPHYLDLALIPVSNGVKSIVDYINANPRCTRRKLIEALAPSPAPNPDPVPVSTESPAVPGAEATSPTAEQSSLIGDLHWLIHQGHVIEFANGTLETAKKPLPRPPKPAAKKDETSDEQSRAAIGETSAPGGAAPATEAHDTLTPSRTSEEMPSAAASEEPGQGVETSPALTEPPSAVEPPHAVENHAETPIAPVEAPS